MMKLPLVHALAWIVLSTILISGGSTYWFKNHLKEKQERHYGRAHRIVTLVQTGPQRDALKSTYLAQLMGLAIDCPQSIHLFDTRKAERDLLRSHVIKEAHVKAIPPQTIYVDYTVRQPVALLYDYENIAIDEEGYLFPLLPFFPPKKLPEIYFALTEPINPLKGKALELAMTLVRLLDEPAYKGLFDVKRIDVSHSAAESYGRREIVLWVEDAFFTKGVQFLFPRLLRLSVKNYAAELGNYLQLREQLLSEECKNLPLPPQGQECVRYPEKVIDLRLPNLAFIE